MNNSSVEISGDQGAQTLYQTQRIYDNYENQIRVSDNSFPNYLHFNEIQNTTSNYPLIRVDFENDIGIPDNPTLNVNYNIRCNCFPPNFDPNTMCYPPYVWIWSMWCPPTAYCSTLMEMDSLLLSGHKLYDDGKYSEAKKHFLDLVGRNDENRVAIDAAKQLIPLEKRTNGNFISLKEYLLKQLDLKKNSTFQNLIKHLINKCDLELKNYPEVIKTCEGMVEKPFSFADSIFSLIDLGNTYLVMTHDSNSINKWYTGGLIQYKPKSAEEFGKIYEILIRKFFEDKTLESDQNLIKIKQENSSGFLLYQNKPNPFSDVSQIEYYVSSECKVTITISDLLGKINKTILDDMKGQGLYSVDFKSMNLPSGVYYYSLFVNNDIVATKKMVIIR